MAGELTKAIRWVGPSTRLQHDIGVDVAGGGLFAVKPLRSMNGPVSRGVRVSRAEWGRGQHRAGTSAGAEGDQVKLEPWGWPQWVAISGRQSWRFWASCLGASGHRTPLPVNPSVLGGLEPSAGRFKVAWRREAVRSRAVAKRTRSGLEAGFSHPPPRKSASLASQDRNL
jgi:hypothetical protein